MWLAFPSNLTTQRFKLLAPPFSLTASHFALLSLPTAHRPTLPAHRSLAAVAESTAAGERRAWSMQRCALGDEWYTQDSRDDHSTTPRARPLVPSCQHIAHERRLRERLAIRVCTPNMREIGGVVRRANDAPNHPCRARQQFSGSSHRPSVPASRSSARTGRRCACTRPSSWTAARRRDLPLDTTRVPSPSCSIRSAAAARRGERRTCRRLCVERRAESQERQGREVSVSA